MPKSIPAPHSLYNYLGIEKSATADEVRKAYKQKALETHPDKLDPGATEEQKQNTQARFHKVCEAFEVLGDPQKRKAYDARMGRMANPEQHFTEEQSQRMREKMRDREQWARKRVEEHKQRMDALREQKQQEREGIPSKPEQAGEYSQLVEDILMSLRAQTPQWEARRKRVQQMQGRTASRPLPTAPSSSRNR